MIQIFKPLVGRFIEWALSYEHKVIVKLDANAKFPFHKYNGDAGYDISAYMDSVAVAGSVTNIHSGVYIHTDHKLWFELRGRSSTFSKKGLEVISAVIDNDYTGELLFVVFNPSNEDVSISAGERMAQIVPHLIIPLSLVSGDMPKTSRGTGGFGSTGDAG